MDQTGRSFMLCSGVLKQRIFRSSLNIRKHANTTDDCILSITTYILIFTTFWVQFFKQLQYNTIFTCLHTDDLYIYSHHTILFIYWQSPHYPLYILTVTTLPSLYIDSHHTTFFIYWQSPHYPLYILTVTTLPSLYIDSHHTTLFYIDSHHTTLFIYWQSPHYPLYILTVTTLPSLYYIK